MKNIFKYNFVGLAVLSLLFSCEDPEKDYPYTTNAPVGSLSLDKTTIDEVDLASTPAILENTIIATFNIDKPYKTDISYKVEFLPEQSTGKITDVEFNIGPSGIDNGSEGFLLTVPKNTLKKVFTITANDDDLVDGSQTLKFKITPAKDLNGLIDPASSTFTITVGNKTSNDFKVKMSWGADGKYTDVNNEVHDLTDFDFDLYVVRPNNTVIPGSQTGAPVEVATIMASSPDGTYELYAELYSFDGAAEPMLPISFDVDMEGVKPGVFTRTLTDKTFTSNTEAGTLSYVGKVVKTGTTYEVFNADDVSQGSGRSKTPSFKRVQK
jgi:hypothetical protein